VAGPSRPLKWNAEVRAYLMLRRPDQAVAACRKTLEVDPAYPVALRFLGEAFLRQQRYDDAAAAFGRIEAPVIGAGFVAYCHARCGREREARQILGELQTQPIPSPSLQIALVHLGLADRDSAVQWLGRSCDERSIGINWIKVEPIWDPLRDHPGFASLLGKLHLLD
jgi:hypothetical protein